MIIVEQDMSVGMSDSTFTDDPREMKHSRTEHPTGWLYLCQHTSIHYILDALLQVDPNKEFTKTELAEFAGVSTQSVRRHLPKLVELGVVAETANGKRYHYDLSTDLGQLIVEVNGEIAALGVE